MKQNCKHFRKRDAILTCLRSTDAHPSAEQLHQMLQQEHPDISLATVYRNLALFKEQGLIQSLGIIGGMERFDGNIAPHVHFVCTECFAVIDLPQISLPQQLCSTAETAVGGRITDCQLTFSGVCQSCCANHRSA